MQQACFEGHVGWPPAQITEALAPDDPHVLYGHDARLGSFETLGALKDYLVAINEECGRRAQALQMPLDWPLHGLYIASLCKDGTVVVTHKYSGEVGVVDAIGKLSTDDFTKVHILKNYSKTAACLGVTGQMRTFSCLQAVSSGIPTGVAHAGAGRKKLALADGASASPGSNAAPSRAILDGPTSELVASTSGGVEAVDMMETPPAERPRTPSKQPDPSPPEMQSMEGDAQGSQPGSAGSAGGNGDQAQAPDDEAEAEESEVNEDSFQPKL